ncbi:CocE/NonD family hydrolase [Streptomyces sp. B21-108]|uniref:CocE/NonD family hydrolase n=1 Tax=Streptomyces sp. B21-108 TaxID=3039419 RepID=UPI002FEFB576
MEKYSEELGPTLSFRKANPLSASEPPVPALDTRTVVLEKGSVHDEGAYPLPCNILLEHDVAVTLPDGTVLYADIYRPTGDERVPVILVYTPYCKRGGWWNENFKATKFGVPAGDLSGLQAFEAPDPGYWCDHGYAIAVVDAAGTSHSGGDQAFQGTASGRRVHDVIEWLAARDWCTGKVAMAGNSQLAMIQWAAAALRPPHLAAIAPWEGLIDSYRSVVARGGIPDTKFHDEDITAHIFGEHHTEDLTAMIERFPLMNAYWADKRPELGQITVPVYVVASWTSPIHPHGTLQAFREIASSQKWLRLHNDQEWLDLADPVNVRDLRKFFDRYLKDVDNDWAETPRVRLSVLDPGGTDVIGRPEENWPLPSQQWRTFFLDAGSGALSAEPGQRAEVVAYDGADLGASVRFSTTFDTDVEITGHLNLHLWVEAADADDMDLFAAVYKEGADGKRQHHITLRAPEARAFVQSLETDGQLPAALSYTGPVGRLRVSHRAVDPKRSTPSEPFLTHVSEELLTPGECVPIELSLWPTSMVVHAGERLVVEVAGHPVGPLEAQGLPGGRLEVPTRNRGEHRIRTGGRYDSHLLLPVVP